MKTIIAILLTCVLSLNSLANTSNEIPFASTQLPSSFAPELQISKITGFNANIQNNRVSLNWTVDTNQDTNQFEVERSTDGKSFTMAALVFGTDKTDTDQYQFFEKAKSKKLYYRIKILHKDQTVSYSDTIIATAGK
ncbi:MAG: hypothetical protein WDN26_15810 [Chitinophagaceae bacterium]